MHDHITALLDRHARHCHRGDAFPAANRAEAFIRCRFDADARFIHADRLRDCFSHCRNVRRNFWRFGDKCRVDIDWARFVLCQQRGHLSQNLNAAHAAN